MHVCCMHTYMPTCLYTYVHTYSYIHTYIDNCIHTFLHTYNNTYIPACIHTTCIHSFVHFIIHLHMTKPNLSASSIYSCLREESDDIQIHSNRTASDCSVMARSLPQRWNLIRIAVYEPPSGTIKDSEGKGGSPESEQGVCETARVLQNNDSARGVVIDGNNTRNCTYLTESAEANGRQAEEELDMDEEEEEEEAREKNRWRFSPGLRRIKQLAKNKRNKWHIKSTPRSTQYGNGKNLHQQWLRL